MKVVVTYDIEVSPGKELSLEALGAQMVAECGGQIILYPTRIDLATDSDIAAGSFEAVGRAVPISFEVVEP